jgi:ferritin-like metal-binding protein YciE
MSFRSGGAERVRRRRGGTMKLETFQDLITHQVQDLYSAEQQFAEALPAMADAASDEELQNALETHVNVTRKQIDRLEKVAKELGVKPGGHDCAAAEGLVEEGREVIEMDGDPMVRDAAIIAAAQRMEHYEIAGYGTLKALAQRIKNKNAARLLDETLEEERGADMLLTEIAEGWVNEEAAS